MIKRKYLIPRALSITMMILVIPGAILFEKLGITFNHILIFGAIFLPICAAAGNYRKKNGRLNEPLFFEVKLYNFLDRHMKYRPFDIQTRRIEKFWRHHVEDGTDCNFEAPPELRYFPDRCYLKGVSFVLKARKLNMNSFRFETMFFVLTGLFFMLFPMLIWEFPEEIKGADREQH